MLDIPIELNEVWTGGRLKLLLIQSKTDVDIVAGATRQNNTADE